MVRVRLPAYALIKMEEQKENKKFISSLKDFYNKRYKLLFVLTAILILSSVAFIFFFNIHNHDFIYKDISLSGGTLITINSNNLSVTQLQHDLPAYLGDVQINSIKDIRNPSVINPRTDKTIAGTFAGFFSFISVYTEGKTYLKSYS